MELIFEFLFHIVMFCIERQTWKKTHVEPALCISKNYLNCARMISDENNETLLSVHLRPSADLNRK